MPKTAPATVAPFLHPVFLPGLQLSGGHRQPSLPVRSQVYPDPHRQMRHPICHGSGRILPVQSFLPHSKNQAAGYQQLLFRLPRSLPLLPVHLLHRSAVCFRFHLSDNPVYRYFQLHRHEMMHPSGIFLHKQILFKSGQHLTFL